jgi:lysine 2,3-aminomutase
MKRRAAKAENSRGKTVRSVAGLAAAGLVARDRVAALDRVAQRYPVALTPAMAALIDPADPGDPIARQFLPDSRELVPAPGERADPIGDAAHSPVKGVVHRYPDRVLLLPVHVCPVYCRYCFRREVVGPGGGALTRAELAAALDYIRDRREIFEVILSGGDPLMLAPEKLAALIRDLAAIDHVHIIRIHSRVPVADPAAVTPRLAKALTTEKALYLVLHCNHPREVTPGLRRAALTLTRSGVMLLSQSVLLRGVNADAATLEALFRTLLAARIKPYYLHHPDPALGTAHFALSIDEGRAIVRQLRGRLSGLAEPLYVLDIPGGHGKVPVGPVYAVGEGEAWRIEDPAGRHHRYP